MSDITNRKPTHLSDDKKKTTLKSCAEYLLQLALAMGQQINPERTTLYLEALNGLSEKQLAHGFGLALRTFKPEFGKAFPYPAELLELCEKYVAVDPIAETRKYLERSDKPADWEPIADDIPAPLRVAASRARVTKEEIAQWLEDGKRTQQAKYALLAKDPLWRAQQARFNVPAYRNHAESLAALRNGKSEVPEDPDERYRWARRKEVEMGWREEREAGDEL